MRKPLFKTLLCLSLLVPFTGNGQDKNALEAGFMNPAEKVQTSVYWYWISGNISEEGVKKDLYSMKEAGINRAFIGNIGLEGIHTPYKTVPFYSEEWWKILHAALKTATELGIEIGIFNSPGWSQSGGPWVKPEQAMRYLASVKAEVSGGKQVEVVLAKPDKDFQDVRVIAFPSVENKEPVNLDDPSKIVAVTRETNYLLPYDDGKRKYRYVVTAVDRFHNENQGKSKKVKL